MEFMRNLTKIIKTTFSYILPEGIIFLCLSYKNMTHTSLTNQKVIRMYPYEYTTQELYFYSKDRYEKFKQIDKTLKNIHEFLDFIFADQYVMDIFNILRNEYNLTVSYAYILNIKQAKTEAQERALYLFMCIQFDNFLVRMRSFQTFLNVVLPK